MGQRHADGVIGLTADPALGAAELVAGFSGGGRSSGIRQFGQLCTRRLPRSHAAAADGQRVPPPGPRRPVGRRPDNNIISISNPKDAAKFGAAFASAVATASKVLAC
jgi:hypothetical protein